MVRRSSNPVAVMIVSFVIAFIVAKLIDLTIGFRVDEDTEVGGIDRIQHGETAYELGENTGAGGSFVGVGSAAARAAANKEGASA